MSQNKKKTRSAIPLLHNSRLTGFDFAPLFERAQELIASKPGLALGIAAGAGFLIGVGAFSRVGRVLVVGALGLGAELLQQRMRDMRMGVHSDDHAHTGPTATA